MSEISAPIVKVGLLLPFEYNLYQVAILLDVFTKANQICEQGGLEFRFDVQILQTQGQINEYSNTFFHYPVVNTLAETIFDYIILPPFNTEDISEIIDKNKVFKDWIISQFQQDAKVLSIGNGTVLAAYAGLLENQEVNISGLPNCFFQYFKIKRGSGTDLQFLERVTLCSGSIRVFYLLFDLIFRFTNKNIVIQLAKYYQVDLNVSTNRHFSDFEFVFETNDVQIDLVLEKIHTQFASIRSLDDILTVYPESRRNFNRKFFEQIRMTPIEYLQNVRISNAKHLLEFSEYTVDEIAHLVGYVDVKSFRVIFTRIAGIQPLDYRKRMQFRSFIKENLSNMEG